MSSSASKLKSAEVAASKTAPYVDKPKNPKTRASNTSPAKDTSDTSENTNELNHQFSKRTRIQSILRKTRIIGIILFVIELLLLIALGYTYMHFHHPHFMSTYIPKFIDVILLAITGVMMFPFFILLPYASVIAPIVGLVAVACLGISIYQLREWLKLKLPDQKYSLAISSIVLNSLTAIPIIFVYIILAIDYLN